MFRKIARQLGIPDALKLYCARHTFGIVAMAETRNPGLVKEVMGHESLSTTMVYLHPETAQIKNVIDRRSQQKDLGFGTQPQKRPQAFSGRDATNHRLLKRLVSAEGIEPSTY
jgi:hypothetical protein